MSAAFLIFIFNEELVLVSFTSLNLQLIAGLILEKPASSFKIIVGLLPQIFSVHTSIVIILILVLWSIQLEFWRVLVSKMSNIWKTQVTRNSSLWKNPRHSSRLNSYRNLFYLDWPIWGLQYYLLIFFSALYFVNRQL